MALRRHVAAAVLASVALVAGAGVVATALTDGDPRRPPARAEATGASVAPERSATAVPRRAPESTTANPSTNRPRPSDPVPEASKGTGRARPSGGTSASPDERGQGAAESRAVAEVPDSATPGAVGLPGLQRAARRQRASAVELARTYPALQVRRGSLAADHPRRTLPVPAGAKVRSSSLATESGVTQVGLVMTVTSTPARVLRFYRVRLGELRFRERGTPPVASGSATSLRRKEETITVAVRRVRGATAVTLHATLRTGG